MRTADSRLVYYSDKKTGELYDHSKDPGELHNLWNSKDFIERRMELTERLFSFTLSYSKTFCDFNPYSPIPLLSQPGGAGLWTALKKAYQKGGN